MCVAAHPDDESLGFGGTLARAAADGVEVSLVVVTRGERGRHGDGSEPHPGQEALGRIREAEVRAACDVLGVRHIRILDYLDGDLDRVGPAEASARIALMVRELRPQVVVTFDPLWRVRSSRPRRHQPAHALRGDPRCFRRAARG